jgi:hypothetical protein
MQNQHRNIKGEHAEIQENNLTNNTLKKIPWNKSNQDE